MGRMNNLQKDLLTVIAAPQYSVKQRRDDVCFVYRQLHPGKLRTMGFESRVGLVDTVVSLCSVVM
jgi:hypothetical protein